MENSFKRFRKKYKSNILTSLLNSDDIKDIITDGKYEDEWYRINDDDNGILYKQISLHYI